MSKNVNNDVSRDPPIGMCSPKGYGFSAVLVLKKVSNYFFSLATGERKE